MRRLHGSRFNVAIFAPPPTTDSAMNRHYPSPPAADTGAAPSALRVLVDGQTVLRWMLARFTKLSDEPRVSAEQRAGLVWRLCLELAVHIHVKEEQLYPALRERLADTSAVDRAEIEHECMRTQIERLLQMSPDDPGHAARVAVLAGLFEMQVEHEKSWRPLLREPELQPLGRRMARLRDELLAAPARLPPGLRLESEELDPVGAPPR